MSKGWETNLWWLRYCSLRYGEPLPCRLPKRCPAYFAATLNRLRREGNGKEVAWHGKEEAWERWSHSGGETVGIQDDVVDERVEAFLKRLLDELIFHKMVFSKYKMWQVK